MCWMGSEIFTVLDGELISYCGSESVIIVPSGVRKIMEGAFLGCVNIVEIILPEGVEEIGRKAFWGCVNLQRIIMPHTLRSIGLCAFRECESLMEIEIPEGVKEMGDAVFRGCGMLRRVYLPDTLKTLGSSTFSDCFQLSEVRLPTFLKSVSVSCFHGCVALEFIDIPARVRSLDKSAFLGCSSLREVRLHEGLREIGRHCFEGCRKLSHLDAPDSLEVIGANAFYKSAVMSEIRGDFLILGRILVKYTGAGGKAVVPVGVRVIGDHAFAYNEELTSVILPESVTEVQDCAFERCTSLEEVVLPEGLKRLGKGVFSDCTAFEGTNFPPNLDHIGANIFYGTAFDAKNTEDMLILSGKYLISFRGTADKPDIPEGIEVIADEAFVRCGGVKEISLPYGLRTIGDGAFRWRSELKKVSIPSTVTYIGENAFVNCHEPEIIMINPHGWLGENGIPDGTRLRVVVGSRVLKIRLTWEVKAGDCPERRLWNFVCVRSAATFAVLQKPEYKLSCAICFYDDGKWYRDYIRKNIVDAVCFAAIGDDISLLEKVLSYGVISREQLQTCIEFAIQHKLTQQQVMMQRYRHENFEDDQRA